MVLWQKENVTGGCKGCGPGSSLLLEILLHTSFTERTESFFLPDVQAAGLHISVVSIYATHLKAVEHSIHQALFSWKKREMQPNISAVMKEAVSEEWKRPVLKMR